MAERRDVRCPGFQPGAGPVLRATDRAVTRLDDNPDATLPPDELYALEAVIRADGTRPSLLIRTVPSTRPSPRPALGPSSSRPRATN